VGGRTESTGRPILNVSSLRAGVRCDLLSYTANSVVPTMLSRYRACLSGWSRSWWVGQAGERLRAASIVDEKGHKRYADMEVLFFFFAGPKTELDRYPLGLNRGIRRGPGGLTAV